MNTSLNDMEISVWKDKILNMSRFILGSRKKYLLAIQLFQHLTDYIYLMNCYYQIHKPKCFLQNNQQIRDKNWDRSHNINLFPENLNPTK